MFTSLKFTWDGVVLGEASPEGQLEMSLQAAARYELLKARALSVLRDNAALAQSTSANDFNRYFLCSVLQASHDALQPKQPTLGQFCIPPLVPGAREQMHAMMFPLDRHDLAELRGIWKKISDLPHNSQLAMIQLSKELMKAVPKSASKVTIGKNLFEYLFYNTLSFD